MHADTDYAVLENKFVITIASIVKDDNCIMTCLRCIIAIAIHYSYTCSQLTLKMLVVVIKFSKCISESSITVRSIV